MAKRWSEDEDAYLMLNYDKHDIAFLTEVLERSEQAVRKRYYHLKKSLDTPSQTVPEREFFLERSGRVVPRRLRRRKPRTIDRTARLSKWQGKGNAYAHTKTGYRPDLSIICRSGWEANILRVLKSYDISFEFEPTIFTFPIKRGNKGYTPDIYLNNTEEWIEVKGYLDNNSKVKLRRFKKYYSDDFAKLTMIISKSSKAANEFCRELGVPNVLHYEVIGKLFKHKIDNWEGR